MPGTLCGWGLPGKFRFYSFIHQLVASDNTGHDRRMCVWLEHDLDRNHSDLQSRDTRLAYHTIIDAGKDGALGSKQDWQFTMQFQNSLIFFLRGKRDLYYSRAKKVLPR